MKNHTNMIFLNGSRIERIGNNAFLICTSLESIELPPSLKAIGINAFALCTTLETVIFGSDSALECIGSGAFSHCTSLESIEIPACVTTLGAKAFNAWESTQTIYIKGFSSEAEADAAWGIAWRDGCSATIVYQDLTF